MVGTFTVKALSSVPLVIQTVRLPVDRYGGYIQVLQDALTSAGVTSATYTNRGINGGFIKDIRDGYDTFPDFNTSLAQDNTTIACETTPCGLPRNNNAFSLASRLSSFTGAMCVRGPHSCG